MIIIVHRPHGKIFGHCVAYENGKVYDPANGIFSEAGFNIHYHGWRMERVIEVDQ